MVNILFCKKNSNFKQKKTKRFWGILQLLSYSKCVYKTRVIIMRLSTTTPILCIYHQYIGNSFGLENFHRCLTIFQMFWHFNSSQHEVTMRLKKVFVRVFAAYHCWSYMYICMYVCTCVYVYVYCICLCMYICICLCMYICMYVYVYVCM